MIEGGLEQNVIGSVLLLDFAQGRSRLRDAGAKLHVDRGEIATAAFREVLAPAPDLGVERAAFLVGGAVLSRVGERTRGLL